MRQDLNSKFCQPHSVHLILPPLCFFLHLEVKIQLPSSNFHQCFLNFPFLYQMAVESILCLQAYAKGNTGQTKVPQEHVIAFSVRRDLKPNFHQNHLIYVTILIDILQDDQAQQTILKKILMVKEPLQAPNKMEIAPVKATNNSVTLPTNYIRVVQLKLGNCSGRKLSVPLLSTALF